MARYNRYSNDPYWLNARFNSICAGKNCNNTIKKGEKIFYYPIGKKAYCTICGQTCEQDFLTCTNNLMYER